MFSRDLEDILTVVEGRPSIADEILDAPAQVREFVRSETGKLMAIGDFVTYLENQNGGDFIRRTMERMVH